MLRRLISILLLAVFGLPCALPLLALGQDADAGLPACCRRTGKHHCSMSGEDRSRIAASQDPKFEAPAEKCPYLPGSVAPTQSNPLATPPAAAAIFADLVSHPASFAQTAAKRRISRDRSNQKRGPPTQTSL